MAEETETIVLNDQSIETFRTYCTNLVGLGKVVGFLCEELDVALTKNPVEAEDIVEMLTFLTVRLTENAADAERVVEDWDLPRRKRISARVRQTPQYAYMNTPNGGDGTA